MALEIYATVEAKDVVVAVGTATSWIMLEPNANAT